MTKSNPNDDFFGIEYISSSSTQKHNDQQSSSESTAPSQESIGIEKLKTLVKDSQRDQLPGSVYLDSTYFPELVDPSISKESAADNAEPEPSDFDKTYFKQVLNRKFGQYSEKLESRESDQFYEDLGRHSQKEGIVNIEANSNQIRESDKFYEDIGRQMESKEVNASEKPKRIRQKSKPVLSEEQIAELKAKRMEQMDTYVAEVLAENVIYSSPNLIAFNKPYNLAYSGNLYGYQIDRALQKLKFIVAPKVERLYLVRSLDKDLSGVMLFATSQLAQSEARDLVKEGKLVHKCISYGKLKEPIEIDTPLVKIGNSAYKRDWRMEPLTSNKTNKAIHYGKTLITPRKNNDKFTYLTATTTNELHHQLRCHLKLAKVPLYNDIKYGKANIPIDPSILPPKEQDEVIMRTWDLFNYQGVRKAPMFSHLVEMRLPNPDTMKKQDIVIQAPLPRFFIFALKKMKIFVH